MASIIKRHNTIYLAKIVYTQAKNVTFGTKTRATRMVIPVRKIFLIKQDGKKVIRYYLKISVDKSKESYNNHRKSFRYKDMKQIVKFRNTFGRWKRNIRNMKLCGLLHYKHQLTRATSRCCLCK